MLLHALRAGRPLRRPVLEPGLAHAAPDAWQPIDTALLLIVVGFSLLILHIRFLVTAPPVEDAAMLLRYAQHLAQGHGIRWNIDQPPVDGATDFLYMVATAGLARLGHIGVLAASRVLNLAAHGMSVMAVFVYGRRLWGANRWLCAGLACYLAAGPAVGMATGGFGGPFFAATLLAAWIAGWCYLGHASAWRALVFALLGLLAGLTRPEGVLIACLLLAGVVAVAMLSTPKIPIGSLVLAFGLVFLVLGGAYFGWHWRYFGHPLPNPFYVKGGGHLYARSVGNAVSNLVHLLGPALVLVPLGWMSHRTRPRVIALLVVLIPFGLMWILLNNQNNHFMRFQYAVVPLALLSMAGLAEGVGAIGVRPVEAWTRSQQAAGGMAGVLLLTASIWALREEFHADGAEAGMRSLAERLQPLAPRGYTMVVTEAGDLPFYSGWRTIDALGLNDATIAHGGLNTAYLDRFHPELILVHMDGSFQAEYASGFTNAPEPVPGLYNQELLNQYARTHGYTLAAAWGNWACNLHFYWLRPGFADFDEVLHDIRDYPYYFLDNGALSTDYRLQLGTLKACVSPWT